jgi:hypothetical protein
VTPEFLWDRYASIWSSESAVRESELAACLADACSYCDANGLIEGRDALSAYMGGFQQNVKGGNSDPLSHPPSRPNARRAELLGPGDAVLQTGRSFAIVADDGRLRTSRFFDPAKGPRQMNWRVEGDGRDCRELETSGRQRDEVLRASGRASTGSVGFVMKGALYLRVDEASRGRYAAFGCQPFAYETRERRVTVAGYYQAPAEAMDEPTVLREWVTQAHFCGRPS